MTRSEYEDKRDWSEYNEKLVHHNTSFEYHGWTSDAVLLRHLS